MITIRLVSDDPVWQMTRLTSLLYALDHLPASMTALGEEEVDVETVTWAEGHAWTSAEAVIADCVVDFDEKLKSLRVAHDAANDERRNPVFIIEARYAEMDTCADFYLIDEALGHACHGEPGVDSPQDCRDGSVDGCLTWLVRVLGGTCSR